MHPTKGVDVSQGEGGVSEPPPRSLSAHSVIDVVIMSLETFEPDLNCVEKYILLMIIIIFTF